MNRTYTTFFFLALAPGLALGACGDTPAQPQTDGGADASAPDGSTLEASTSEAGTEDANVSTDSAADTNEGGDAGFPVRAPMCGLLNAAAPADGTFYDTTSTVVRDRTATRLLTAASPSDAWVLWDARTGQAVARGIGHPETTNDTRATLRGDVLLTSRGDRYETRDARTGVVLTSFATPGVPFRAYLSPDASYVALVTDAAITFATPQGAVLRTVAAASLPLEGVLPYGSAAIAVRDDGVWIAPSSRDTTVFVPKAAAAAPRAIGPFPGGADAFNGDGSLVIYTDFGAPAMASFRDATGAQRGTGLAWGAFQSWGNYAWIVAGNVVTLYSIAGASAAVVGTYTKLDDATEASASGYLAVREGIVSLRGASPVLTAVVAYPAGATGPVAVDAASGAWAMNASMGGAVLGDALTFTTFGEIAGCTEVRSIAAAGNGKLLVAFADHVEQLDTASGRFDARRDVATKSRIFVSEVGGAVVTDEPAAYDLVTFTKTATFTAGAVPLSLTHDGTRVALLLPAGQVEERNPRTGALLATHPSVSTALRARAVYSPDATKLAVVRSVGEPVSAGAPVTVITDLYSTVGAGTAETTHYPMYWESPTLLATELLPSGSPNPPRWNAFEGTCSWSGAGTATSTPGASLGVRAGPSFSTYQRQSNGLLFQELPARVGDLGSALPAWSVPDAPSSTLESRRATFSGRTFFWVDRNGSPTAPAGVRRHVF